MPLPIPTTYTEQPAIVISQPARVRAISSDLRIPDKMVSALEAIESIPSVSADLCTPYTVRATRGNITVTLYPHGVTASEIAEIFGGVSPNVLRFAQETPTLKIEAAGMRTFIRTRATPKETLRSGAYGLQFSIPKGDILTAAYDALAVVTGSFEAMEERSGDKDGLMRLLRAIHDEGNADVREHLRRMQPAHMVIPTWGMGVSI